MEKRKYRVAFTDHASFPDLSLQREILERVNAELVAGQAKTEDEVIEAARDADGLINQYAPITKKVIQSLDKCRVIARTGIGVDTIDVSAATEKGICVANVPDYCVEEVAEFAMALVFALAHKVILCNQSVRDGSWNDLTPKPKSTLKGKTVGILGFGKIGRALAQRAKCMDLRVISHDPYVPQSVMGRYGVIGVSLDELTEKADIISIHSPLTKDNFHLFGENQFRKMKRTALLVNTSRGPIIDEKALYEALKSGRLQGAALDVLEKEPPAMNNPLLSLNNVIITPHTAWYSEESFIRLSKTPAEEVARVLRGEWPKNLVNPQVKQKVQLR